MPPGHSAPKNSFVEDAVRVLEPLTFAVKTVPVVGNTLEGIIGTALVVGKYAEASEYPALAHSRAD